MARWLATAGRLTLTGGASWWAGVLLFASLAGAPSWVHARDVRDRAVFDSPSAPLSASGAMIAATRLPSAALAVLDTIRHNGPFHYGKDGTVFGNREHLLPKRPRGYYREYTVPTPWARDRGARRIVCGRPAGIPDECYYTDDHYNSFRRIQG